MTLQAALDHHPAPTRDRDVIRVDFTCDRMGIAASLRRAFAADAYDQGTRDLEKLLRELD